MSTLTITDPSNRAGRRRLCPSERRRGSDLSAHPRVSRIAQLHLQDQLGRVGRPHRERSAHTLRERLEERWPAIDRAGGSVKTVARNDRAGHSGSAAILATAARAARGQPADPSARRLRRARATRVHATREALSPGQRLSAGATCDGEWPGRRDQGPGGSGTPARGPRRPPRLAARPPRTMSSPHRSCSRMCRW